ncbi:FAD/NAD(P)-binding domain-containing protein [Patellaria atrata CBS 101060]|uniref:FAD/NAD(P)-binding domain-containing protein n=1 Tax=Patellaria atrata CBS 101060 TaxID=1346257 RepID=A0A9P4SCU4_9PEZI|nr:FAD/NAD(P)-binding domain-containing protein [Patellaria atrata CBS 101060]
MAQIRIYVKIFLSVFGFMIEHLRSMLSAKIHSYTYKSVESPKNIVVIGASFAGLYGAKLLADSVPTGYRVIVIEKNSHFNFTWVFPRFSVVSGQEHKAFVPYRSYLASCPNGSYQFIQGMVTSVNRNSVQLEGGKSIDFEYLVVTTGATGPPPSRVGERNKEEGIVVLKSLQNRIQNARDIVVVGGGAAGIETVSDIKERYPEKNVSLVHSRTALLNHFGARLQAVAKDALENLGVKLVLDDRVVKEDPELGVVTLKSQKTIQCDQIVNCVGQTPQSSILAGLSPACLTASGNVQVLKTLQLEDPSLRHVYAAGDIIQTEVNKNSRSAMEQATVVAKNIIRSIQGRPLTEYQPSILDKSIVITLGLVRFFALGLRFC